MEYEIDIEEHDLLDNPVIKTMFPDISVIKKEITQYFEEEPFIREEPECVETIEQILSKPEDLGIDNTQNTLVKPDYLTVIENETLQNSLRGNKIILGSKPKPTEGSEQNNYQKLILGSKPVLFTKNDNMTHIIDSMLIKDAQDVNKTQLLNSMTKDNIQDENKIKFVVGSKSYTTENDEINRLNNTQNIKLKEMKIVLQDIHSFLNQRGTYCTQCCRLFPSKTALNIHRKTMHYANFAYRNKIVRKIGNESQYKCCICGAYVSNRGNLVRHYKNIHNKNLCLKKNDKETSEKTKANKSRPIKPKHKVIDMKTTLINGKKKQTKIINETKQSAYRCKSCCISFATNGSLTRHLKNIHKVYANNDESKIIQKIAYDLVIKENEKEKHQITLPIKQNMKTATDEQINKFISYVEKHKDITIRENPKQIAKFATDYENEMDSTEETHKVRKNNDFKSVQSDSYLDEDVMSISTQTKKKDSNICLHCNKEFADKKLLIEHMYEVLEPKGNSSRSVEKVVTRKDNKILFLCRQCSYYLSSVEAYFAHLSRNHKTETFLEVNKEEFDAQCKYCPYKASNITTHNRHVHSYHIDLMFSRMENEIKNDEKNSSQVCANIHKNSFALESVLFECNRCCICFLSSDVAKDHDKHNMDSLTNWKCSFCNHILKAQYKELHLKQHSFSQPLKVYNLNETAICSILYHCTKCAIHFKEKRYQEHFPNCDSATTDSAYCSTCDILIDKMDMRYHKNQHDHLKDKFEFTIIDSNIIIDNITTLKRKGHIHLEPQKKPKKKFNEQYNSFTYCSTCKSYLTCSGIKNESHIKKNCFRLHTYPCDECGLVFTSSTLETHKEHHEKDKNLKLQDFKFFNLQGIQIRPAIPEYPQCKICKIHFLRRQSITRHICEETIVLTCDICNIKLSENTYKLHMTFHFYVLYSTSIENDSKRKQPNQVLNTDVYKKLELLDKPEKREEYFESKTTTELDLKIRISEISQSKMQSLTLEQQSLDTLPMAAKEVIEIDNAPTENSIDVIDETNMEKSIAKEDFLVVMYTCEPCGITVDSYDEVINHCQTHYSGEEIRITSIEKCNICSLKFDSHSRVDHEKKVHSRVSKIRVLNFDPCYFKSKNMVWMKHIFPNFSEEIVKVLLKNSIYKHEHRIRMECIQKGSLPLYVYKCDLCGYCVEPGTIYEHTKSPCRKVRKHPCSLCGLPFVSIFSRSNHEKLHRQVKNLNKKSFKIILFNQSKDKTLNDRILSSAYEYVLYQCRNCDRVAERTILSEHECDRKKLKKCVTCHLLLSIEDFEAHASKHKHLENFCSKNLKVILLGHKNTYPENVDVSKTVSQKQFSGTVYDYTLYECEICKICIKSYKYTKRHTCLPNPVQEKTICSKCKLKFLFSNLRYHIRQHNADPHYIKENMNVISFNNGLKQIEINECKIKKNIVDEQKQFDNDVMKTSNDKKHLDYNNVEKNEQTDIEIDYMNCNDTKKIYDTVKENENNYLGKEKYVDISKEINIVKKFNDKLNVRSVNDDKEKDIELETVMANNVHEEVEILYKCKCGLHFLHKPRAEEHKKKCHPKELKQSCSKCHLLFNSSELFSHLLVHHKDKTKVYNFRVIEI